MTYPEYSPHYVARKRCVVCGLVYARSAFSLRTNAKDGLQDRCKPCDSDIRRVNRWALELSLTRHQVERCLAVQEYGCPVCAEPLGYEIVRGDLRTFGMKDELCVDVDDRDNLVRGLVHRRCLTRFPKTDLETRRRADYLSDPPMTRACGGPHYRPVDGRDAGQTTLDIPDDPGLVVGRQNLPHPTTIRIDELL